MIRLRYHGGPQLSPNGERMKFRWIAMTAGMAVAGGASAALDNAAADAMMKKDGCAACHSVDKKIVGPAYQDRIGGFTGGPRIELVESDHAAQTRQRIQ